MIATTELKGRLGNNFYQIATCIAYAKRNGLEYHIPTFSPHMAGGANLFEIKENSKPQAHWYAINERTTEGNCKVSGVYSPPQAHADGNVMLKGYWQSFKYFEDYREDVLQAFDIPSYAGLGAVSIHVRRADYLHLPAFDTLPMNYYDKCIAYFKERGYKKFMVFSDDMPYCYENFKHPGCEFIFSDGNEFQDFVYMANCEHHITANSSFSFAAAWLNRNPDKIVLCPDERYCWFNTDYIPEYYTKIPC